MVYLLRISINLQVFYILGACSSAQILSVSSWPHPVVYHSFSSCIAHKMKWYLCTKDWPTKALLNSDVWTLHMHVCLPLIYFKPPPSVLLSACECHEVSASWFACLVCARQENKQMITGRENQSILKLCCLSFLEWKREFCRGFFHPWIQYFGQLLSGFNVVHNAYMGNLIPWWLFASLGDICINQTPTE